MTRRDVVRGGLLAAGAAAAGGGVAWFLRPPHAGRLPLSGGYAPAGDRPSEARHPEVTVTWYVETDEPVVAFTFDDGPAPHWTPMVLDILDEHRVPATFFVTGANLRTHGDLLRGRLDRHAIGSHSWSHPDFATMDLDAVKRELTRTHAEIVRVTGRQAALLRPPYGHLGGSTLLAADCLGYRVVLWSHQMHEARFARRPDLQVRDIVDTVTPGAIVLAHDVGNPTRLVALRRLGDMIAGVTSRGLHLVTVPELLALSGPARSPTESRRPAAGPRSPTGSRSVSAASTVS
jgi:peptidoglycan/xylan/chitin deacetylase (PgdA/CDA1 family)